MSFEKPLEESASEHAMSGEQICEALKALIEKEKAEGDSKDVSMLEQAYGLCEQFLNGESSEGMEETVVTGGGEGAGDSAGLSKGLTMGPMGNFKSYLAKASVDHQSMG